MKLRERDKWTFWGTNVNVLYKKSVRVYRGKERRRKGTAGWAWQRGSEEKKINSECGGENEREKREQAIPALLGQPESGTEANVEAIRIGSQVRSIVNHGPVAAKKHSHLKANSRANDAIYIYIYIYRFYVSNTYVRMFLYRAIELFLQLFSPRSNFLLLFSTKVTKKFFVLKNR